MKNLKFIDWSSERELIDINDIDELNYEEEGWSITFEYEGVKIFGIVDFSLTLKKYEEEETGYSDVEVVESSVVIKKLDDEYEDVFEMNVKDEIALQNELAIDLKMQY